MTLSSRALSSALTPFQQAAIARELPRRGAPGVLHNTIVSVEGRRFAVTAARPVGEGDWEAAFSAVVARRANARVDRLLPVVATGCHDRYHWVAYETGRARPLVADGWRRWPARLALDLVSDVANALDEAAAFGIVPYELLPSSIFMDPRLGPLLGDLGAAREAVGSPPADDDPGRLFTPPEVVAGGVAGARSSVYVCGALLYALLSGGPPRNEPITRWREDVPDEVDLVLARATARDTLERYRSAAEFAESVRRALELPPPAARPESSPELEPLDAAEPGPAPDAGSGRPRNLAFEPTSDPAFQPASEPAREPVVDQARDRAFEPTRHPAFEPADGPALQPIGEHLPEADEWRPPVSPAMRRLRLALAVGSVAAAAVIGFQVAQPDPPARASGAEVAAAGLRLTLPAGWSLGEAQGRELLAAYPSTDWFAGLTIRAGEKGSEPRTGSDPVRLGDLDMWRDTSEAPRVVRYVLPTNTGPLLISCEATAESPQTTLSTCERSLSTLRLDQARPLPLEGVSRKPGMRAAVDQLRRDRVAGRAALARARTPQAQKAAALALERANTRAAKRLGQLPDTDALAAAASRAAGAYGALAQSAGAGRKQAWEDALTRVRRAEAALASELKQQG